MKNILMNMCMIHDVKNNKVVILDKEIKYGWEGKTFPGGHVEMGESIYDSCVREVFEETGLKVKDLSLKGIAHWETPEKDLKEIGFLYYTKDFNGNLIEKCDEGFLYWMDLNEFIKEEGKSDSMDDMLKIFLNDNLSEAMAYVDNDNLEFRYY